MLLAGCSVLGIGGDTTARFEVRVDTSRAVFIEGALTFVTIDEDDTAIQVADGDSHPIPSGPHVLHSYVRPCDGNCGSLDAPTDACAAPIDSLPGQVVTITIVQAAGQPCTIAVAPGSHPASS